MKYFKPFIIFCMTFGLMMVLLDTYVRYAAIENTSLTSFSEENGRVRPRNKTYVMLTEGFSIGRFNAGRYLNDYYPPRSQSSDNTIRIALLGDSYVESFQVFKRDHFASLLSSKLKTSYDVDSLEMLNFGRSGFDIADIYACKKTLVSEYHPDVYLLFVCGADLYPIQTDPLIPRVICEDGALLVSTDFNKSISKSFQQMSLPLSISPIACMLNKARKNMTKDLLLPKLLDKLYVSNSDDDVNSEAASSSKSLELDSLTMRIIDNLEKNVIIVNRQDKALNPNFVSYINDKGLKYIDLSIPLQRMYSEGKNPHYWEATNKFGHWNREAHQIVADYLYLSLKDFKIE